MQTPLCLNIPTLGLIIPNMGMKSGRKVVSALDNRSGPGKSLKQEIGWQFVSRAEAEARRSFDSDGVTPEVRARPALLYFGDREDKGSLRVT